MDLNQAQLFLNQLDGHENPLVAFRTFQDNKDAKEKDPSLTTTRYGKLADLQEEFIRLNQRGAGIFYNVNVTDGKGFAKGNIIRVRAVFADLDGVPLEPAQNFKLKPQIVVQSSPGRYHCIWLVDHEKNPLDLGMFEAVQTAIAERFKSDKTVKDLPRVLRLPGFFHRKSTPFLVNLMFTHEDPPRYSGDQILDAFAFTKAGKPKTLPIPIPQGQRDNRLMSFAGSMRRMGASEESIFTALVSENKIRCIPPLEESELKRIAHSVSKYDPVEGDFIRNDKTGVIYPNNQQNIKIGLEKLNIYVKYNVFADQYLIKRKEDGELQHLDDIALKRIWLEGDEAFRFRPSKEFFTDVVLDYAADKGRFHPVKDYLESLKWDGTPRIDRWLIEQGGATDAEYTQVIGRLILMAAVRRIFIPGCKFDQMLVLESEQGKDKSSVLKALCPDEDWFSDGLPLNADTQKVIEQTSGKWIVEAAELSGMKKSDVEHLKNFLSRSHDIARKAYDRMVTTRPRHFVLIGTTNSSQYLKDSTGNRRVWPVKTPGFDVKKLKKVRDQLWAEAVIREKETRDDPDSIVLPKHLWQIAEVQQEKRRIEDPWELRIVQTIDTMRGKIFTEDVWKIVGMYDVAKRSQADNIRIGDALRRLGFERIQIRIGEKRKHGYVRADNDIEKLQFIKIRFDDDNQPEAYIENRIGTAEWEKAPNEPVDKREQSPIIREP